MHYQYDQPAPPVRTENDYDIIPREEHTSSKPEQPINNEGKQPEDEFSKYRDYLDCTENEKRLNQYDSDLARFSKYLNLDDLKASVKPTNDENHNAYNIISEP